MLSNKHNLLCFTCGRPLVAGQVDVRRSLAASFGIAPVSAGGSSTGGSTFIDALTCPNSHNYYLVEAALSPNDIFFSKDTLALLVDNEGESCFD